jgi:UDP-GlcNAc:undecaprenyl-phosphate GlcNAc-1-phosphate transferase
MLVGLTLVEMMGLIDDRQELGPLTQFGTLLVASAIVVVADVRIDQVTNPLGTPIDFPVWFALLFTVFWLTGMSVTVNWLDGLDGLAAGVTLIASVILFVHTAFRQQPPQPTIALLPATLAGCALGFLPFNRYPARIFLGSSGAYFFGFTLACLSIIGGAKVATALLVLGIPVLDVAWQIVARLRRGTSPFLADRGHLHHRLYDLGLSQQRVVWLYWGLCAMFGLLALVLSSRVYKLGALVVMGLIVGAVLVWVARKREA